MVSWSACDGWRRFATVVSNCLPRFLFACLRILSRRHDRLRDARRRFARVVSYGVPGFLSVWFGILSRRREDYVSTLCVGFSVSCRVTFRRSSTFYDVLVDVATLGVALRKSCILASILYSLLDLELCRRRDYRLHVSTSICQSRVLWRPDVTLSLIWGSESACRRLSSRRSVSICQHRVL